MFQKRIGRHLALRHLALWLMAALAALLLTVACNGEPDAMAPAGEEARSTQSSASSEGKALFNRTCAVCHGLNADGTQAGPPLVDAIYRPGHHPDISFRNAVKNGVVSHHWNFGHMPPQPGVSDDDIEKIICYVRELQIAGGIYEGDAPC